jgi:hypothetical protein
VLVVTPLSDADDSSSEPALFAEIIPKYSYTVERLVTIQQRILRLLIYPIPCFCVISVNVFRNGKDKEEESKLSCKRDYLVVCIRSLQ